LIYPDFNMYIRKFGFYSLKIVIGLLITTRRMRRNVQKIKKKNSEGNLPFLFCLSFVYQR